MFSAWVCDCFRLAEVDVDLAKGADRVLAWSLRGRGCAFVLLPLNWSTQFKQAWEDQSSVVVSSGKGTWE